MRALQRAAPAPGKACIEENASSPPSHCSHVTVVTQTNTDKMWQGISQGWMSGSWDHWESHASAYQAQSAISCLHVCLPLPWAFCLCHLLPQESFRCASDTSRKSSLTTSPIMPCLCDTAWDRLLWLSSFHEPAIHVFSILPSESPWAGTMLGVSTCPVASPV